MEKSLAEDLVVTKYKMAGEITNKTLKTVIEKSVVGASVRDLCKLGDQILRDETSKQFKKEKEMKKGIAFPTCISVNNCVCNFSPLKSDPDYVLKDGDVAKIELGGHIDGFIAVVAHTIVVGHDPGTTGRLIGRKADVILAAHYASEAALRLVKPSLESDKVTSTVTKIAEDFECKPIEGMLSRQLQQNEISAEKCIIQNPNEAQRKEFEKCTFELHEVYAIDVLISTGDGKGKEVGTRASVYKRTMDHHTLKLKTSRAFFKEVFDKHGSMAFNLRDFEDENRAKLGVNECVTQKVMKPYHVFYEKPSEIVAQFKFTVLLKQTGSHKITGLSIDPQHYDSECKIWDKEIDKLLATPVNPGKNKKKPNKTGGGDKKTETKASKTTKWNPDAANGETQC